MVKLYLTANKEYLEVSVWSMLKAYWLVILINYGLAAIIIVLWIILKDVFNIEI